MELNGKINFIYKYSGLKGLLVEPNPDAIRLLLTKKRKAHIFPGCLSTKRTPEVVKFDVAGLIGGIIHKGREPGGVTTDPYVVKNVSENENILSIIILLGINFQAHSIIR
jgi:hypothetical protein